MRFVHNKSYRINEWPTVNYNVTDLAPGSEKIGRFIFSFYSFRMHYVPGRRIRMNYYTLLKTFVVVEIFEWQY